jgi:hypothetical protein
VLLNTKHRETIQSTSGIQTGRVHGENHGRTRQDQGDTPVVIRIAREDRVLLLATARTWSEVGREGVDAQDRESW